MTAIMRWQKCLPNCLITRNIDLRLLMNEMFLECPQEFYTCSTCPFNQEIKLMSLLPIADKGFNPWG